MISSMNPLTPLVDRYCPLDADHPTKVPWCPLRPCITRVCVAYLGEVLIAVSGEVGTVRGYDLFVSCRACCEREGVGVAGTGCFA